MITSWIEGLQAGFPRPFRGTALAVLLSLVMLTGCDSVTRNTGLFQDDGSPADPVFGALVRGHFDDAEAAWREAQAKAPRDPYVLLAGAILHQNTGRHRKAEELYEEVLAVNPDISVLDAPWWDMAPVKMADLSRQSLMELGLRNDRMSPQAASPSTFGRQPQTAAMSMNDPGMAMPGIQIQTPPPRPRDALASADPMAGVAGAAGDANIISRFETLSALRDTGLITSEEYQLRREANIGALLPLTEPPPAAGLERSVPDTAAVVGRLRALKQAFENRALSAREHAAERSMILDGLLPAAPLVTANPATAPDGLLEAASRVRRLETLRMMNLISADEAARERQAVEAALQGGSPGTGATSAAPRGGGAPETASPQMLVPRQKPVPPQTNLMPNVMPGGSMTLADGPRVHIASFQSEQGARDGWQDLRSRFADVLSGFVPDVEPVTIANRGTYYRLLAGPVASASAATRICRQLNSRGQFCEPAT